MGGWWLGPWWPGPVEEDTGSSLAHSSTTSPCSHWGQQGGGGVEEEGEGEGQEERRSGNADFERSNICPLKRWQKVRKLSQRRWKPTGCMRSENKRHRRTSQSDTNIRTLNKRSIVSIWCSYELRRTGCSTAWPSVSHTRLTHTPADECSRCKHESRGSISQGRPSVKGRHFLSLSLCTSSEN